MTHRRKGSGPPAEAGHARPRERIHSRDLGDGVGGGGPRSHHHRRREGPAMTGLPAEPPDDEKVRRPRGHRAEAGVALVGPGERRQGARREHGGERGRGDKEESDERRSSAPSAVRRSRVQEARGEPRHGQHGREEQPDLDLLEPVDGVADERHGARREKDDHDGRDEAVRAPAAPLRVLFGHPSPDGTSPGPSVPNESLNEPEAKAVT